MLLYGDVETGGLSSAAHKVLEVAIVLCEDGKELRHFHHVVNPGEEYLERDDIDDALAINGLTREVLRAALPEEEVVKRLNTFWLGVMSSGMVIDGNLHFYNNAFDSRFLCNPPWNVPMEWLGECVMLAAADIVNPRTRRWPKLVAAAEHFSLEWQGRPHGALSDARMAGQVHHKILQERV